GIEGAEIAPVPAQHPPSRASPEPQPSPGICDGGRGQSHLQLSLYLFFACRRERREALEAPSAEGSPRSLCGPPGEGGCWAAMTLPRGSHRKRHPEVTSLDLLPQEKLFEPGEQAQRHSGTLLLFGSDSESTASQSTGILHACNITGLAVLRKPPGSSWTTQTQWDEYDVDDPRLRGGPWSQTPESTPSRDLLTRDSPLNPLQSSES
ncbi:hypothetical protein L3Q82_026618, partial [Scortum barcoo]